MKCRAASLTHVLHERPELLTALAPGPPWKTQSRMEKLSVPKLLVVLPPGKGDGKLCSTRPVRRRLTVQQLLATTRHLLPSGRGMTSLHRRCASSCGCSMSCAAKSKTHPEVMGSDVGRWRGRACRSTRRAHQADPRSGGTSVIHSGCMSCPAKWCRALSGCLCSMLSSCCAAFCSSSPWVGPASCLALSSASCLQHGSSDVPDARPAVP